MSADEHCQYRRLNMVEDKTCTQMAVLCILFFFFFFLRRTVDLANLMLIPLINPLTNPFPHAKEICRSAQG